MAGHPASAKGLKGLTLWGDKYLSEEAKAERDAKLAADKAAEDKAKHDASALAFKPMQLGKKVPTKAKQQHFPKFANVAPVAGPAAASSSPGTSMLPQQQLPVSDPQAPQPQPAQKRTYDDFVAEAKDDQQSYSYVPPQQWSKKKGKKPKTSDHSTAHRADWDAPYDVSRPTPYQQYAGSEDFNRLRDSWQGFLKKHAQNNGKGGSDKVKTKEQPVLGAGYAPPSFAPPANYGSSSNTSSRPASHDSDAMNIDESGEDAFARRAAMGAQKPPTAPPVPFSASTQHLDVPEAPRSLTMAEKMAEAKMKIAKMRAEQAAKQAASAAAPANPIPDRSSPIPVPASLRAPLPTPIPSSQPVSTQYGVIVGAPVYNPNYAAEKAQQEEQEREAQYLEGTRKLREHDDADGSKEVPHAGPRSKVPGQSGAGMRIMEKQGYQQGQGLGARGEGIQNALYVQRKKNDKMGHIKGGHKKNNGDGGSRGKISSVVKFDDMLDGLDIDKAIQDDGLLQEIGDEMKEFGNVERIKIWRSYEGGNEQVFVKFNDQISALKAIEAMDGAEFEGNVIKAGYWDEDKFEAGEYA